MMKGRLTMPPIPRGRKSIFTAKTSSKISVMNQKEQAATDRDKDRPLSASEIVEMMREGLDGFSPEAPPKLFSEEDEEAEAEE